jgi:nicotinate-nucleotide--dimethylbenzimidazole phosphoribosyltransferase
MTRAEALAAMDVGRRAASAIELDGATLAGVGEVGIGNTTAAAAIVCALTGADADDVVGRGTGVDESTRERKVSVVRDGLRRLAFDGSDPVGVLAEVGGLELGAMAGFILECTARRIPVVLDGFLSGAAALVAARLRPDAIAFLLASHLSDERGSRVVLDRLGLAPVLSLGLRLGEGTGSVLGIDIVRTAVALQNEMATFANAGTLRDLRAGTRDGHAGTCDGTDK